MDKIMCTDGQSGPSHRLCKLLTKPTISCEWKPLISLKNTNLVIADLLGRGSLEKEK